MKNPFRTGKSAFTLIELMTAIGIIVILAALVITGLSYANERQAKAKAAVQMAHLAGALENYKLAMGYYPRVANTPTDGSTHSATLYQALFYEGYDYNSMATPPAEWTKATTIHLPDLDPTTTRQGWVDRVTTGTPPSTATVKDPWGNEYRYRSSQNSAGGVNSSTQNEGYDLWSVGRDGKTDAAGGAGSIGKPENRDDIRNF